MASVLKVDKLDPQSGTALEIGTSGDTVSIPSGATLDISASTLTPPATMPASSGVNLTALNATQLTSGTVPAARLSGLGKILQVVQTDSTTAFSTTSTSLVDVTGYSATITPSATSSKILVMAHTPGMIIYGGTASGHDGATASIIRDTTNVYGAGRFIYIRDTNASNQELATPLVLTYLDSPSTTDATTYKVQVASETTDTELNFYTYDRTMVLMEIGA